MFSVETDCVHALQSLASSLSLIANRIAADVEFHSPDIFLVTLILGISSEIRQDKYFLYVFFYIIYLAVRYSYIKVRGYFVQARVILWMFIFGDLKVSFSVT